MQTTQANLAVLVKNAIDAALKENWALAIKLNHEILDRTPGDLSTKIRLGRAYLQTSEFTKAKMCFEEVLEVDPINQIALKNLKKARQKKIETMNGNYTKNLIKEPGTYTHTNLTILNDKLTSKSFEKGEMLTLNFSTNVVKVYRQKTFIGAVDEAISKRLKIAYSKKSELTVKFINGTGKQITLLITSTMPVFKSDKQEVRPYLRKGSIDEPELELNGLTES